MANSQSKKITSKVNFYHTLLLCMMNNQDATKKLNISKQNLYYHRRKLQELGFLKKDKNLWIVLKSKKEDLEHTLKWKDKSIRGHAFIWKIKTNRIYDWKRLLDKKKVDYKLVRGLIPRLFKNKKKVWLGKESITVYENKSFYGKNAIESRKYAVYELQSTITALKSKLGIDFKYYFKPVREHFGMIKNELARQCNERGEKILIRDTLDGEWFWVDDSTGMLGEMETGGKGFTKDRAALNMEVQNWWNDMKKTDFKVTPSFLLEKLNEANNNFNEVGKTIKKSSETMINSELRIKQMQSNIRGLTELVYQLIEVVRGFKDGSRN